MGGCTLRQPGEYDWTVHVWLRCGIFVKLLWPLVISLLSAMTARRLAVGKRFNLVISISSHPPQIAVYRNAIKVTADGPREPRVKTSKLPAAESSQLLSSLTRLSVCLHCFSAHVVTMLIVLHVNPQKSVWDRVGAHCTLPPFASYIHVITYTQAGSCCHK